MKSNYKRLGEYIRQIDVRNKDDDRYDLLGVSVEKCFINSIANTVGTDWHNYKIIKKGQFCYIPDTSRRGDKIGIAHLTDREIGLVSAVYTVFEVWKEELVPEYLMLWFKRPEFDRYARFHSHGSVREIFDWEEMCNVELPIPAIEEQKAIVNAYETIERRIALKRKINDNLAESIRTLFRRIFIQSDQANLFPIGKFSSFITQTIGGDWGESAANSNRVEVICIRGADIPYLNAGLISNAPTRFILKKNAETKRILPHDIIVEISGGSPTQSTGRIAMMSHEVMMRHQATFICSNFCRVIRIDPSYLYYFIEYWNYLYRNNRMFCYENSSTGLKNFDLDSFLNDEDIPIPPKAVSVRFNTEVAPMHSQIIMNGFEIAELERLKSNILPKFLLTSRR